MRVIFAICKNTFVMVFGLICSTENNNKAKYATDVLPLDTTGMVHTRDQPKRDVGTFYPDIGCTYTQEMFEEERGYERPRDTPADNVSKGPVVRKKRKKSKAS
jgi:hypothetical protein